MIDIFEGSARDKFYDILFNANALLVKNEIDKIFEKFVALSELCERHGISEDEVANFVASEQDKIYNGLNDLYIGLSGEILSQNE
ncbi:MULTISPECIES: DUF2018 family protein [Campylobacter]|uniref:DUF2018 family protein n=1 Tax=Campylobacter TaxID=194 RepID=UPI000D315D03|nr:DUF2018 family protein [Campylobacter concisus]